MRLPKERLRLIDQEAKRLAKLTAPDLYKVNDGPGLHGLYLQVAGPAARSWIYRYTVNGRQRDLGLGSAFLLPLADAAAKADAARLMRAQGLDPIEQRRAEKTAQRLDQMKGITFKQVAEEYITQHAPAWRSDKHAAQWRSTLASYVYPQIGELPVQAVDVAMVLDIVRPLWLEKTETASRVRGRIEAIINYATPQYRVGDNPARWMILKSKLPRREKIATVKHHAALPYAELPAFMAELRARPSTSARALEILILTCARTSELVAATWPEFDLDAGIWTIPGPRMKAGKEHRVPLPSRAVAILRNLHGKREGAFVFPGANHGRPLSSAAMAKLLVLMGRDDITLHGFRSSARTWAAESTTFPREICEAALAHVVGNKVEAAYQRGDLFTKRAALMNAWAGFCSTPAPSNGVVSDPQGAHQCVTPP